MCDYSNKIATLLLKMSLKHSSISRTSFIHLIFFNVNYLCNLTYLSICVEMRVYLIYNQNGVFYLLHILLRFEVNILKKQMEEVYISSSWEEKQCKF